MFKITPIQEKSEQKRICELCNTEFRADAFAYQMFDVDSGEIMGMSQFEIAKSGYIYDIKEGPGRNDFEAMFILARQTMNFIDLCGVHTCYAIDGAASDDFIKAIGFKMTDGKFFCDMTGMFDGSCGEHNPDLTNK